eukprot:symbB.v1.2.030869.t1/scaffold3523.1/size54856/1
MQHFLACLAIHLAAGGTTPADIKARVEEGQGVPFFDERFNCREDGGAWSAFRELVEYGRLQVFDPHEGEALAKELLLSMANRTSNISLILQCNVGVIAGYHLLARRYVAAGDDWRAYRLLQLALIYVFTLRNALRVPEDAARDWATRTDRIVSEIKILKERLQPEQQRRYLRLPQVDPTLRIHDMRVAVVSICAYPLEHPLVLRNITPDNRKSYGNLHGYDVHVHYDHPMPGEGVHIQHSKLQLVADYLRSGLYDWVAWFDCDSIITNLNRTLDSVIFRYARRDARFMPLEHGKTSGLNSGDYDTFGGHGDGPEPLEDEVLESFVGHVGSCNSDEGCFLSTTLRVNPRTRYVATLRAAQIDMAEDSEKLSFVTVGGQDMGECNPKPDNDFDCRLHNCFTDVEVPAEAVATGRVTMEARAVRTHNDCHCNRIHGICYSAALAALEEAAEGEKAADAINAARGSHGLGETTRHTLSRLSLTSLRHVWVYASLDCGGGLRSSAASAISAVLPEPPVASSVESRPDSRLEQQPMQRRRTWSSTFTMDHVLDQLKNFTTHIDDDPKGVTPGAYGLQDDHPRPKVFAQELASMRSMDGAKFGGVWRLASAATNMCPRGNSSEDDDVLVIHGEPGLDIFSPRNAEVPPQVARR